MTPSRLHVFLSIGLCFLVGALAGPSPPTWPSQYYLTGTFSIPYFNISLPITANNNEALNRQRYDYYGGLSSYLYLYGPGKLYEVVPRVDKHICMVSNASGPLSSLLPDMSLFYFRGVERIRGWLVENWEMVTLNFTKVGVYNMYIHRYPDGRAHPVRFYMNGHDNVFDSHPDIYIFDYDVYIPNYNLPNAWTVSPLCDNALPAPTSASARLARKFSPLMSLFDIPRDSIKIDPETSQMVGLFEKHLRKYGKSYPHPVEYSRRLAIFKQNWEFIQQYNKLNTGVTLAMNHFGDWSAEEFRQVMLPKSRNKRLGSKKDESTGSAAAAEHNSRLVAAALPSTVDWVAKGAVTPVKDQGACGSCWTFGTTGTVEGAHFIKHGKLLRLSEQQIIDCAWGYEWSGPGGNLGCDGGYAAGALQWLIDNGGIAREEHYPYLMEDAFCLASDIGSGARVTGYVNVTAFSEPALQAAVALNGPVAVAIDAAHPEFTFYSSGVYYNPRCGSSLDALDHEVLAVGYGVYQGQEYWLVKNSWSTHWGMNGYVMMARNRNNNCGIASQANYAIVA